MKTINAAGGGANALAAVRAAAERGEAELEVLLDDPVSASGVMRFLESSGFAVQLLDDEGTITLTARKGARVFARPAESAASNKPAEPAPLYKKTRPAVETPGAAASIARPHTPQPPKRPAPSGTLSVLITRCALGSVRELGEALMENFLAALTRAERPPLSVSLINEGVKLARYDSSSCDHLKRLEKKGVSILVCGTCVNYFGMMDETGAGSISGMDEILEAAGIADKIITV